MRAVRIAVIGGGSSYTPEIIEGLLARKDRLPVSELWLVDIREGESKLRIVTDLARRMVKKAGDPFTVHETLDRREALRGADFVLSQFRVGLLAARVRDEKIPLRHGAIGQETVGAGGFAKALRTIPVTLALCRDIEELCPDAFLVNFTNPSGIVTEAVAKHTRVKVVGLCNNPINMQTWVANKLGVAFESVFVEFVGCNHHVWGNRVLVGGADRTREVLEIILNDVSYNNKNIPVHEWPPDLLLSLGAIPNPYFKYYFFKDKILEELLADQRAGKPTRGEVVQKVEEELFRKYADPALDHKPEELSKRGGALYSEAAVRLIASIHDDARDIQAVSTTNRGALAEIDDDAVVEVNCTITSQGPLPIPVGRLRPQLLGFLQLIKAYEALTIEAAVHGDRGAALQALVIHPLVPSYDAAKAILADILAENAAYLPQFAAR